MFIIYENILIKITIRNEVLSVRNSVAIYVRLVIERLSNSNGLVNETLN